MLSGVTAKNVGVFLRHSVESLGYRMTLIYVIIIIGLAVSIKCQHVTDTQTHDDSV